MGPRFCKRGNLQRESVADHLPQKLQWGHAFVSVETFSDAGAPTPANSFNGATLL